MSPKRCSNCVWTYKKLYCSKKYGKPRDNRTELTKKQLHFCQRNNFLHAKCAENLREKQLYLQRIDIRFQPILENFTVIENDEDIFSLHSPEKSLHFYKTTKKERQAARDAEWSKIKREEKELDEEKELLDKEWDQVVKEWEIKREEYRKKRVEVASNWERLEMFDSGSDEEDDERKDQLARRREQEEWRRKFQEN